MRKFLILILFVMCFGVVASSANAQGPLGTILKRMDDHNKALQSLKADLTMVKTDSTLGVSDTSTGTTTYLPKTSKRVMYARIDWIKPRPESLSVIGDDFEMFTPARNLVYYGKAKQAKNNGKAGNLLAFIGMSKEELKANYTVIYIGEEQVSGGIKTWHLQLTPKGAASYKSADIWVDGDGMPRQVRVIESNNDSTTLLVGNPQKNGTIKAEMFKIKYPDTVVKQKV